MMGDCKECGCQCKLCNANSLDLHHDIEVLKASVKEARLTVSNLKKELKVSQEVLEETQRNHQSELSKCSERYERLLESHRRLEVVNHDLEDKILMLVQDYDAEKEATMGIHEDIHNKLKAADKRVEDILLEKDTLASQCRVAMDLLKKYQSNVHVNGVLVAKEVTKLNRTIKAHEERHPIVPSPYEKPAVRAMPLSTFPPCAMMFDHSPKPIRRGLRNDAESNFPRTASDSRLAKMAAHPTNIQLCANCKDVSWIRSVSTQTPADTTLINREGFLASQTFSSSKSSSGIFDV